MPLIIGNCWETFSRFDPQIALTPDICVSPASGANRILDSSVFQAYDLLSYISSNSSLIKVAELLKLMHYIAKNGLVHRCAMTDAYDVGILEKSLDFYLG